MNIPNKLSAFLLLALWLSIANQAIAQPPDTLLAQQYLERATALKKDRKLKEAISLLNQAATIFSETELWEDWLKTKNRVAVNFRSLGDYDQSLLSIEEAITTGSKKVGQSHRYVNELVLTKTTVLYGQGDFQGAIELSQALLNSLEQQEEKDDARIFRAYSGLSVFYEKNNEYDKALDYGLKALNFSEQQYGISHRWTALSYERVGNNLISLKKYEEAIPYHQKCLELRLQRYKDEDHYKLVLSYSNLGICFAETGKVEEAESYFLKAFKIGKDRYQEVHPWTAGALWNLGMFYDKIGKEGEALNCFLQEKTIREQLQQNQIALAGTYNRIGDVYRTLNKIQAALEAQNQALSLVSDEFSPLDVYANPTSQQILSNTLAMKFAYNKIETFYDDIKQNPSNSKAAEAGIALGDLCLDLWYTLRYELGQQEKTKQIYSKYTRNAVRIASLLAQHLYEQTKEEQYARKAWQLAERGKSLLLLEAYLQADASEAANLPREVLAREKQLSHQLAEYESQLLTAIKKKDTTQIDQLRNHEIFDTKVSYERLIKRMEQTHPDYYNLKYNPQTVSLEELQILLPPNQILVKYLVAKKSNELLIFTIEKEEVLQIYKQKLPANIDVLITEFNRLLQSYLLIRKNKRNRFIDISHDLYRLLLQPLEARLKDKKKMVIIGEDFINYIPFDVLLPTKEEKSFEELDFFIRHMEISYHYSATLYARSNRDPRNFDADLLAFAPVFEKEGATVASRSMNNSTDSIFRSLDQSGHFTALPHTEEEVKGIASLFRKQGNKQWQVLLKEEASEQNLKTALKKDYRFVHLASHSFSNLQQPKLSGVACIASDEEVSENGILFSGEIYNMKIQSDLLVLSSCESGVGTIIEGEGMLGLNRSFVHAGVPNVVFSLWKVYDKITNQMMLTFYTEILNGASYSKALQTAKLQLLKDKKTASPHYWSAFLLIGR